MDGFGKFALELVKLSSVAVLSAYVVSRLTAKRFISERHWEIKFEHYNRLNELLTRIRGFVFERLRPVKGESFGFTPDDAQVLRSFFHQFRDGLVNAELVLSHEATELAWNFWIEEGSQLPSSELRPRASWEKTLGRLDTWQRRFREIARHDLEFASIPLADRVRSIVSRLRGRLRRRFWRRKFSPELKGSSPSDPQGPAAPLESS
jgi:hypothetical protein